ncbi:MAG TPA: thymidylate synthase [Candidatus Saccharimonadales bacterium]|nr:thymidylate synthase [Candidatus Saccharimonadales bacterium]
MYLSLIVAVDQKGGISKNGSMPWHIKKDSQFFHDVTTRSYGIYNKNALLMGKNTWLYCKDVIKNRIPIVISSTLTADDVPHGYVVKDIYQAEELMAQLPIDHVFVCGGKHIYEQCVDYFFINQLFLTIIENDYECDNHIDISFYDYQTYTKQSFELHDDLNLKSVNVTFMKCYLNKFPNFWQKTEEHQYLTLLHNVLQEGHFRQTRNAKTWSLFGKTLTFDLSKSFPLLTTKKVFFRGVFEELLFFLRGDTNTKHLEEKGVTIWKANTSREFLDSVGLHHYDEGDMGPIYSFNLRHFGYPYHGCDDYTGKGFDQIDYVLNLLKHDPFSRRIVMTTFDPSTSNQGCLYPCHGYHIQFYVTMDKDNTCYLLSCMMTQRSADLFLGLPFNITSYSLLVFMICEVINNDIDYKGLKFNPHLLSIVLGDTHIYQSHASSCIRQLLRDPHPFPKLVIKKRNIKQLTDFTFDDLELIDYQCYPTIVTKMIA